jgi:hypothetical protein
MGGAAMKSLVRKTAFVLFSVICAGALASAAEKMLVLTEQEFEANLDYLERGVDIFKRPGDPLAPQIYIDAPDVDVDVAPPVNISVRFEAADGATIDLNSLRVKYGWFDITKRVLESMQVSANGISGKIGSMRRGKYTLKVSISDTLERKSSAKIVFKVVQVDAKAG